MVAGLGKGSFFTFISMSCQRGNFASNSLYRPKVVRVIVGTAILFAKSASSIKMDGAFVDRHALIDMIGMVVAREQFVARA